MRYRALDPNNDYSFGNGSANFLVDDRAAVGQAVLTRLRLGRGEWFLDLTEGMPYSTEVFVEGGRLTADQAAKSRILGTQGVKGIAKYSGSEDSNRKWTVGATIDTIYGRVDVVTAL